MVKALSSLRREGKVTRSNTKHEKVSQRLAALQDISSKLMRPESGGENLLHDILEKSLSLLVCDAGSLYLKGHNGSLVFEVSLNRSIAFHFERHEIPTNNKGLAAHVLRTGESLNLKNVHEIPSGSDLEFDDTIDRRTGYRTRSVLAQPLVSTKGEVLGVLQLINRKWRSEELWPSNDEEKLSRMPDFSDEDAELLQSFAAVASSSIENANLYKNIEALFEGFVVASVHAIEARDPATRGHSDRVALLTVDLAEKVSNSRDNEVRGIHFTPIQIAELRYAALLHDFGKIGVPESVLNKEEKLSEMQKVKIRARFTEFKQSAEIKALRQMLWSCHKEKRIPTDLEIRRLEKSIKQFSGNIEDMWSKILDLNQPTVLTEDRSKILTNIEHISCEDCSGHVQSLLEPAEIKNLKIVKGSLSQEERFSIEEHVTFTYEFLKKIPWTQDLSSVPEMAYTHHEMLNGTGYPRGVKAELISSQTRIMTICDIFDALVANDRPYKPALSFDKALSILEMEAKAGKLDARFLKVFIEAKVFDNREFAYKIATPAKIRKRAA